MPKRLVDNINSRYFEAANHMRPAWKKHKIIVYVESYDDIFFWRDVLSEFESDDLGFEIVLPSRTGLGRGKKSAITNNLGKGLGTSMIACVDADLDYLLQGRTQTSREILNNPFIVHTYVYAIESYQCYAESLHNVCVMATLNDRKIFDFVAYLTAYSRIIYDLFVWAIWLYRNGHAGEMPLTALCNIATVHRVNIYNPEEGLEKMQRAVNQKIAWLQRNIPEAKGQLQPLKDELTRLGVTPDQTYLYIQGHHIMDNIVMGILGPVCTILRRAREKEIKQHAVHAQQMDNELSCYEHSQGSVEQMIRRNTDYKKSTQYQQMRQHIRLLMKRLGVDENGRYIGPTSDTTTATNNQ